MNILFVASEVAPFAKSGGLADVASALPRALKALRHNVKVVMPRYYSIDKSSLKSLGIMGVKMGAMGELWCELFTCKHGKVDIYFIEYERYFGRSGFYADENGYSYGDNDERFIFLSRAAFEVAKKLNFSVDVIHANDWHTAIMPLMLESVYKYEPLFAGTASVLTIHNMQHQGKFHQGIIDVMEVGWESYTSDNLEDFGGINLLKSGIMRSDAVSTVSPKYAREICTPAFGWGLDGYLHNRELLFGILNGVDYEEWDPKNDTFLIQNYESSDMSGKQVCKREIQELFGLPENPNTAVIGFVGRLAEQKGIELLAGAIWDMLHMDMQLVILGSGERWAEGFFNDVANRYPDKVSVYIGYNNALAHKIEAGADLFLMPSLFEPCGLNQIYSLRYGTLPIVRAVGGLDDTIQNAERYAKKPNGFKFYEASAAALCATVRWALEVYYTQKEEFDQMIANAMEAEFSWEQSAKLYEKLYKLAKLKKELKHG
jgi:starch synthase